jgi:hypothetical protein
MLLLLIPAAWLGILTILVAVCHTAAHGDAQLSAGAPPLSGPIGMRLRLDGPVASPSRARRPHRRLRPRHVPAAAARRRTAAHSAR